MGSYLSKIFSVSPLHELQQHMAKVAACSQELVPLFEALAARDSAAVASAQLRVHQLENEADDYKRRIRLHLPRSLFLPVDRADLLDTLAIQDRIANTAQDIAGVMVGRKMQLPEGTAPTFLEFVSSAVSASALAKETVAEVHELFSSGFRGAEVDIMEAMIKKLDNIERETDNIEVRIRAQLFAMEATLPPVDVMFLYKIIDWIGYLADDAQRVGNRLQLMMER